VVQIDRKTKAIRDAPAIRAKFGVDPAFIPDFLALVGDTADGYPGIDGIGKAGAARLVNKYGPIESFPSSVLGEQQALALKFKELATLKADLPLFANIDELQWRGPTDRFPAVAARVGDARLLERCQKAAANLRAPA
jgi:5'-3' exonuclease